MDPDYLYTFNPETDIVQNPKPILQQERAELTTNEYIKPKFTESEPKPEEETVTIKINREMAVNLLGLMDDLINKPNGMNWHDHVIQCVQKEDRIMYTTVLTIFIVLFIVLVFY